jgi:sedoheptulokinase
MSRLLLTLEVRMGIVSAMIIGLDLGTTSISAVLLDPERRAAICSAECAHNAGIAGLAKGYHEQCAATICTAATGLVASLVQKSGVPPERIAGLALTGQQHGLLVVDAGLNPLTNLITWRDQRTATAPTLLRKHAYGPETGCFLHPGYGGLTLHHLIREGKLPNRAYKVLPITGFVAAQLTGCCSIDETMAASWGILDVRSRCWHDPLLKLLDIPKELLPEIATSCSPLGPVVPACATGLGPQTIVFNPAGDNQAGFAGVGDLGRKEAVVNLGTSAQLSVFSPQYSFSPELETRPFPGGGFLRVYAALCGGWAYAYLAEFFQRVVEQIGGVTVSLSEVFDRMQRFGDSTDANGLCVDTRFAGERNGETVAGKIDGINTTNFIPGNLVRAFANGIAAELASAWQKMQVGSLKQLVVVGNAARHNPLLVRALEKQFDLPCRVLASGEEAALGAARLASLLNTGKRPCI